MTHSNNTNTTPNTHNLILWSVIAEELWAEERRNHICTFDDCGHGPGCCLDPPPPK